MTHLKNWAIGIILATFVLAGSANADSLLVSGENHTSPPLISYVTSGCRQAGNAHLASTTERRAMLWPRIASLAIRP